jgi:predicted DNA-binding transcriptional regulator AlpA
MALRRKAATVITDEGRTAVLREPQAAIYIGLSSLQLRRYRKDGSGPPARKITPNRFAYLVEDLDAWLDERPIAAPRTPRITG